MPIALILLAAIGVAIATLALSEDARNAAAAIVAHVGVWLIWAAQHAAPEIAAEGVDTVLHGLGVLKPTMMAMASEIIKELTGQELDVAQAFQAGKLQYLEGDVSSAFDPIARGITQAIAPEGELTPESGMQNLARLFALNIGVNMQAWVIDLLAALLTAGPFRSAAVFHFAVDQGLGVGRLSGVMWGAAGNEAIVKPRTAHYQRTYMAKLPTAAEAVEGWYRGQYNDEEYLDLMRSEGYSYQRALELLNIRQKNLGLTEALELNRAGRLDDTLLRDLVKAEGYGDVRADLVLAHLKDTETRALLKDVGTLAQQRYRSGDVSEQELRDYLAEARDSPDEVDLTVTREQLALRGEKPLSAVQLLAAFEQAAIGEEELRARMRKQHYADADIDILMATHGKRLSPAPIREAFVRGPLERGDAEPRLRALGYSDRDVPVLFDLRSRDLSERQVLDALAKVRISQGLARDHLKRLGFDVEAVDVLLAFQRKTLSPAEVQAAVLRDLMDPVEARAKLQSLGYSPQDAELIVDLRVRLLTVGQILDAYATDFLSRPTALGDLQARGLSPTDAEALVAKSEEKQVQAATRAPAPSRRSNPTPPA